jgi:hypothetical protein
MAGVNGPSDKQKDEQFMWDLWVWYFDRTHNVQLAS